MKKVIIAVLLAAFIGTGAFAQIMIGFSGALYNQDDNKPLGEVFADFKNGNGIYYGGFGEIVFDNNLGVGLSYNASRFYDDFVEKTFKYDDLNLYISYHLFGGKALLDPFAELGFGVTGYDYAKPEEDSDENNPLAASAYGSGGLGLGINFGSVGTFLKVTYINYGPEDADTVYLKDANGEDILDENNEKIAITAFKMAPVKFTLGIKLIL